MKNIIAALFLCVTFTSFGWWYQLESAFKREYVEYIYYTDMSIPPVSLIKYDYEGQTKFGAVLEANWEKTAMDCKPEEREDEDYQLNCIGSYKSPYTGHINLPQYYTYDDGQLYTLMGIHPGALSDEDISSVSIPATVTLVDKQTFYNCPNLIELDLSSIRNYDFAQDVVGNCPKLERLWLSECPTIVSGLYFGENNYDGTKLAALKEIYSPAVTPLTNQVFDFRQITPEGFDNIKLYVKPGCEEVYRADPLWGQFRNILPYDFAARAPLSEVATSDIEFRVYDTRGNLVATSPDFAGRGIYILQEVSAGTVKTIKIRK